MERPALYSKYGEKQLYDRDVSQKMSGFLRHWALQRGYTVREDGYVKLDDVADFARDPSRAVASASG